jgi:hypothetical protein
MSNPNAPLLYVPLTPTRVIDTRDPNLNPWGHRLEPGNYLAPIATRLYDPAGIPASAAAYALNITVVPATQQDGVLSAYPANLPDTGTSTLNFRDRPVANSAVVAAAIDPNVGADREGNLRWNRRKQYMKYSLRKFMTSESLDARKKGKTCKPFWLR